MDWIKKSIMATKGVGKDASGKTHNLTEKVLTGLDTFSETDRNSAEYK